MASLFVLAACHAPTDGGSPPPFQIVSPDTLQVGETRMIAVARPVASEADSLVVRTTDERIAFCWSALGALACAGRAAGVAQIVVMLARDTTVRVSRPLTVIAGVAVRGVLSTPAIELRGLLDKAPVFATFFSARDIPILDAPVVWSTSDAAVAAVESSPGLGTLIRPLRPGVATITARSGQASATGVVTVRATVPDTASVFIATRQAIRVLSNDVSGLRIVRLSSPAHGTATIVGDTAVSYTSESYVGVDSLWYVTAGSPAGADSAVLRLGVRPGPFDLAFPAANAIATGLNDAGQVSGALVANDGQLHAVRWNSRTGQTEFSGGAGTVATAINAAGDLVGDSLASGVRRAMLWPAIGPAVDLGPRDSTHRARAISDARRVLLGTIAWENGRETQVVPDSPFDVVHGMNARGELVVEHFGVLGISNTTSSYVLRDLGGLPVPVRTSGWTSGLAINDRGWVVGNGEVAHGDARVFLWVPPSDVHLLTPVAFGGFVGRPVKVNNAAWVLWQGPSVSDWGLLVNGASFSLDGMLASPDWRMTSVIAMNNLGQLLGTATSRATGAIAQVLLTPRAGAATP